jgi:chromosome segregation ATPase
LRSEFDNVRDRLLYLRDHPDLGSLEPEILELAAQMSHESRELATIYSADRVERARQFLRQRQEEAEQMKARIQMAHDACRELKRWLQSVDMDEAVVRAQLARLREELSDLFPEPSAAEAEASRAQAEIVNLHRASGE